MKLQAVPGSILLVVLSGFLVSAPAIANSCSSHADLLYERQQRGERVMLYLEDLKHGVQSPIAPEHVANLLDSDFVFENYPGASVRQPAHDITRLLKVPPLGDHPTDEFETIKVAGDNSVPTSIFGIPDVAASKTRSGAYALERFSRTVDGAVMPFSVVMLTRARSDTVVEELQALLRLMRTQVNLTDEQLFEYGVQFAIQDGDTCQTLSYAPDPSGRVGLLYTQSAGNFDGAAANSRRVSAHGASIQRKSWHTLRPMNAPANVDVAVSPDLDNIGLVAASDQDLTTITRTVQFDLVRDRFEQIGPNQLSFSEVARVCMDLAGIKYYDEYQQRTDGRIPNYRDAVTGCMQKSNFKKLESSAVYPIRTRVSIRGTTGGNKVFYVRKRVGSGESDAFGRYRVDDLLGAVAGCASKGLDEIAELRGCLQSGGYQLVATDEIRPRPMFRIERRNLPETR